MLAIFLWIIFIGALLTALALVLAKVPIVVSRYPIKAKAGDHPRAVLHYLFALLKLIGRKAWHFILEAKDLTPPITSLNTQVQQKVKQIFKIRIRSKDSDPKWLPEIAQTIPGFGQTSDPKKSIEETYLAAIKKDPNGKLAYEGLGRLYLQEKNYQEAEEVFRFLINLDPLRDVYYSNLGLSLYSLKKYEEAAKSYHKALSINHKVPIRWINLGLCLVALEDFGNAIKAISNALQFDKRNIHYLSLLADVYTSVHNKIRAEEVLQQILSLDPTHKTAREKLMRLKI